MRIKKRRTTKRDRDAERAVTLAAITGPDTTAVRHAAAVPIHQRWTSYVAARTGVLPGSSLIGPEIRGPGWERYTLQLPPGDWRSVLFGVENLPRIASGLDEPVHHLVLEPHPNGAPHQLQLTVVDEPLTVQPIGYLGPNVVDGAVELGPYVDGDGSAPWRFYQVGDVPNSGRACNGFIVGGPGSGKTCLLERLSIEAMSTGWCTITLVDPQAGASSPSLAKHADRCLDLAQAGDLLADLEDLIAERSRIIAANGWTGLDPSPDHPMLLVFIDEAAEVFSGPGLSAKNADRWEAVARRLPKVGGALVVTSRHATVSAFGNNLALRSALCAGGNVVVMRPGAPSDLAGLPDLTFDPRLLLRLPGSGLALGPTARPTAWFRSAYVPEPAVWMARYRNPDAA